jgi:ABC-2 type transport system ATP-binding protein
LVKIQHGYKSNDVLAYLLKEKIEVVGYNEVLPSLNEIFIQLVEDTHSTTRAFQPL